MPMHCQCGTKNTVDHALICQKGGFVIDRHDALHDPEAELFRECCRDVQIEPTLQSTKGDHLKAKTNCLDQARLDIVATGLWNNFERTYFDVRITHPLAPSNESKSTKQLYHDNEREKMTKYNDRIINIEKSTFCPLVFTTFGGTGPQCKRHHKKIAEVIANKRHEEYAATISFIRTKLRFALLRSILVALRGVRGPQKAYKGIPLAHLSFDLLPVSPYYEA